MVQQLSAHVPLQPPEVRRFRSRVRTWHRLARHAMIGVPHRKQRKMGMDVSSGPVFLGKKRGGLEADISSGLIFLKRKRKKRIFQMANKHEKMLKKQQGNVN